jgi:predicted MFS family arabinose efflux permease
MTNSKNQLFWYTSGNALWMGAYSLQQILVTWILVGQLNESPERVGFAQMLIGIPGLAFMLWGGVIGDRMDVRVLLSRAHFFSAIPPLVLALVSIYGLIGYWILIGTALFASLLNSASTPARATILNTIAADRLQFAITLSTGIGSIAAIAGTKLGGEMDSVGLTTILLVQSAVFMAGGLLTLCLKSVKPKRTAADTSVIATIKDGIHHVWQRPFARNLIGLNFVSSLFNAGGWIVVIPFIVKRVYDGDAMFLANIMVIFTFGSLVSNFGLLKFMPLKYPGRLYLSMQLSRILILVLIWIHPEEPLLWLAALLWGLNMGITTTTSRLMLQEVAEEAYRARVMSIFQLSLLSAAPLGSLFLGQIMGTWGPINALIPGICASFVIFIVGFWMTDIWNYRSPEK